MSASNVSRTDVLHQSIHLKSSEMACNSHRRASREAFDWNAKCFVCGGNCHKKRAREWSLVASAVDKNDNMYTKMLDAAKTREDDVMLDRLYSVVNGDLVAINARYHRQKACYASYINPTNIVAARSERKSFHSKAMARLKDKYYGEITKGSVFTLSELTTQYRSILKDLEAGNDNYRSQYVKQEVESWDDVCCIYHHGKSDLVVSEHMSVGDVIRKAHDLAIEVISLKAEVEVEEEGMPEKHSDIDESIILHRAAGILRRSMKTTQQLDKEYYSSDEMNIDAQQKFADPHVLKLLGWLCDDDAYKSGNDPDAQKLSKGAVSIACDITTLVTTIYSPKHLGLAIYLHHKYGSRKLINEMYVLGYVVSYTELRNFLTSAAKHIGSLSLSNSGTYIPPDFVHKDNGGALVIGVGDNWDHNEHTIDGKRTTHSMTSILVTSSGNNVHAQPRIPRLPGRTLEERLDGMK